MRKWWRRRKVVEQVVVAPAVPEQQETPAWAESIHSEVTQVRSRLEEQISRLAVEVHEVLEGLQAAVSAVSAVVRAQPEPAPAPETELVPIDEGTPDAKYLAHLQRITGRSPVSPMAGRLMTLSIIGRLRDGSVAWWSEDEFAAGRLSDSLLGGLMPQEGDYLRARVVSHVWGHVVLAVVPNSLKSPVALRASHERLAPEMPPAPEAVAGSWKADLEPGAVVLARIPYDGYLPVDRQGRSAKDRPAVFVCWENDYAVLRAIYDHDGWVGSRDLGTELRDTRCLTKQSVVRDAEFDIGPDNLIRRLGEVGSLDRQAMGLPAPRDRQSAAGPTVGTPPNAPLVPRFPPPVSRETAPASDDNYETLVREVITEVASQKTVEQPDGWSMPLSMLGELVKHRAAADGIAAQRGKLSDIVRASLPGVSESTGIALEIRYDHNNLPTLSHGEERSLWTTRTPVEETVTVPIDREADVVVDEGSARYALPDDYEDPELIILDQFSTAMMLGDARVRLDDELARLRGESNAPGYVIGSNEEAPWAAFQRAAHSRGWEISVAVDRATAISAAVSLARRYDATWVTVVTTHADMVRELENLGFEVQVVSDLE